MSKLNLRMKKVMPLLLALMLMATPLTSVAYATENSSGTEGPQSWLDRAKEAASDAADKAREKAPEVWDKTKDVASDTYNAAKEALPGAIDKAKDIVSDAKEGLQNAQNSLSEWNQGQQDQFWQRIDDQLGTNTSGDNNSTDTKPSDNSINVPEPEAPPQKDPLTSEVEDLYGDSGIYYYDPNKSTGDGTDRTPNASVETFEKGDDYVIVDGEKYERAPSAEQKTGDVLTGCMLCVVAIIFIGGGCFLYRESKIRRG